jgi:hypothetical protein
MTHATGIKIAAGMTFGARKTNRPGMINGAGMTAVGISPEQRPVVGGMTFKTGG